MPVSPPLSLLAQTVVEQDGVIDNLALSPAVHRTTGVVVVVAMVVTTVWLVRLAWAGRPADRAARVLLAVTQLALMVQALLGIKLLDQGLGVAQLYIHYVGGLLPLGGFLAAGWIAWRSDERRTRALAVLAVLGTLSAVAAYTIGGAYSSGAA
jgi:MFS family permease